MSSPRLPNNLQSLIVKKVKVLDDNSHVSKIRNFSSQNKENDKETHYKL